MSKTHEPSENISNAVDALGNLRIKKKELTDKEAELTEYIKAHTEPGKTLHGKLFTCDIVASTSRVIDVVKAFKKLGKEKFLRIASITLKKAGEVLSNEDIDALADTVPGPVSVRTKAIPQVRKSGPVEIGGDTIEI